ncbi:MAG: hypothetical protein WDW36_001354 [Sanguina aurantia]
MVELLQGRRFGVAKVPGSGRGLVATFPLSMGTEVHREAPMVCYPSFASQHKVCHHCLKPLASSKRTISLNSHGSSLKAQHCGITCREAAHRQYLGVAENAPKLQRLSAACESEGDRFPLLVSRIASAHLMAALARWEEDNGSSSTSSSSSSNAEVDPKQSRSNALEGDSSSSIDSLNSRDSTDASTSSSISSPGVHKQPQSREYSRAGVASDSKSISGSNTSSSSRQQHTQPPSPSPFQAPSISNAITDLHFLCYANVPKPYPPAWVEYHTLMNDGLRSLLTNPSFIVERGSGGGSDDKRVQALRALHEAIQSLDLDWFVSSLARLHINAFRVETPAAALAGVAAADYAEALQAALAQAISGGPGGSSAGPAPGGTSGSSGCGHEHAARASHSHDSGHGDSSSGALQRLDTDSAILSGGGSSGSGNDSSGDSSGSSGSGSSSGSCGSSTTNLEAEAMTASREASRGGSSAAWGGGGTLGSAIYLMASMFNHSCDPNIEVTFPAGDATAVFTAARDIEAGEELCITYIDSGQAFAQRQTALEYTYGFKCGCVRCEEEAEEARVSKPTVMVGAA